MSGLPVQGRWSSPSCSNNNPRSASTGSVVSIVLDTYDNKTLHESLAAAKKKIEAERRHVYEPEVIRLSKKRDVILLCADLYYHRLSNRKSEVADFLNDETIISSSCSKMTVRRSRP